MGVHHFDNVKVPVPDAYESAVSRQASLTVLDTLLLTRRVFTTSESPFLAAMCSRVRPPLSVVLRLMLL